MGNDEIISVYRSEWGWGKRGGAQLGQRIWKRVEHKQGGN